MFVIDGARTPFLKAEGRPGPFTAVDLAVQAGRPLLARQPFDPGEIDEVILGCVNPSADEVNPGRVAALRLGCGTQTPGWTVQRNCASGMQSIDTAYHYISSGHGDLILAGGTEALSHAPLLYSRKAVDWFADLYAARGLADRFRTFDKFRLSMLKPSIALLRGLTDPVVKLNMGQTAELLAHRFGISREEADEYAVSSHHRLARANDEGWMDERLPMIDSGGNVYEHDTGLRPENSMDAVARLKPAFEKPDGKVTPGNSSQITDGACWVILASEDAVERYGLEPIARIVDSEWAGLDPAVMGLGPVLSATPMIGRNGLAAHDIGAWEINEAFAAQVLACLKAWTMPEFCRDILALDEPFGEIDRDVLNVDGGAISLGHPVGTSGNRIFLHVIHVMKRLNARFGVATECIGGGMGGAMLLERV